MKRDTFTFLAAVTALSIAALPAQRAAAYSDTDQGSIEIVAPLDSATCTATPPTISVLGLTVDVTNADFGGASCADLIVGQFVGVKLARNSAPLTATEVRQEGNGGNSENGTNDNGSSDGGGNDSSTADSGGNGGGQDS